MNAPDLSARLADILAAFAERGITPNSAFGHHPCVRAGLDETAAVALAEMSNNNSNIRRRGLKDSSEVKSWP